MYIMSLRVYYERLRETLETLKADNYPESEISRHPDLLEYPRVCYDPPNRKYTNFIKSWCQQIKQES